MTVQIEMDKMTWDKLAERSVVEKTMAALSANGIVPYFVDSGADAKNKMFEIIPAGSEVMNMSSTTFDTIGATKEIMEGTRYVSVKKKLMSMDRKTQGRQMQMMGSAPVWAVGSVHAVSQKGDIMWASQSGSQLPAYAFGADHVVWIVGTHKIVKDRDEGFRRIYERCLPLETERAKKVYGIGSSVNKILIIDKETVKDRLHLIFVNEVLGF